MRCLHIVSGDLWAGAEVSAFLLLCELHRREGIEVRAILLNRGALETRLRAAGVPVLVLSESETGFFGILRAARRSVRGFRPDVIHTHRYKEHVLGLALSLGTGACHVRSAHGAQPRAAWRGGPRDLGALLDDALADWAGSTWIAVSEDLARRISGLRRRVFVVPNGLPREAPTPERGALGAGSVACVGYAGRLEAAKRPDRFLRVLRALLDRAPERGVLGVMIGDGSLRGEVERLARELALDGHLLLLGHRDGAEALVAALDVLLIPSDDEGLPMVLLEAMRAGVPVVASSVGGMPEALQDPVYLADPQDEAGMAEAVLHLLEDDAGRARRAQRLRARFLERYSIDAVADRVLAVYGTC